MILHLILALNFLSMIRADVCCADGRCHSRVSPFDSMPLPECAEVIQPSLRVYTRSNPEEGQVITPTTIPPAFQTEKRTIFIVHGYMNAQDTWWMHDFKDNFLQKLDVNVIIVGWQRGSFHLWYPYSAANTRTVGARIGDVARHLVERGGTAREKLWCVGHSLGSHICGHAGQTFKLGRITGLDPAGPWFEDKPLSVGLNKDCADFVDAWHTHGKPSLIVNCGTLKPLAHVDFYPNGGGKQPGCILDSYTKKKDQGVAPYGDVDFMPSCSHMRVLDLFQEAIVSDCKFNANIRICDDPYNIPMSCRPCEEDYCQVMGIDVDQYPGRGPFYLTTQKSSPFCA